MYRIKIVENFLNTQIHMIIATIDENHKPEAALVGFATTNELTLIFGTNKATRKYKNILNNPFVAVVFGNNEKITVQYEGKVSPLTRDELIKSKQIFFEKIPTAKKYEKDQNQVWLKIKPHWIRYTDYNQKPAHIFEFTL